MLDAFSSVRQAGLFGAGLLLLAGLPVLLSAVGLPSRQVVYEAVPAAAGPFPFINHQIYSEKSDLDILFVGPSLLWAGIDAPHVKDELSRQLGREANVVAFGTNWGGMDLQYVLLRDFLKNRKVKLVVLNMLARNQTSDLPHIQAFRWFRQGEDQEALEGLGLRHRLAIYGATVLGAPRHLLSLLRPNLGPLAAPDFASLGIQKADLGYGQEPFVRNTRPPPVIQAGQMLFCGRSPSAPAHEALDITGPRLGPYQAHFLARIGKLLSSHGVSVAVVHVPVVWERGMDRVPERQDWSEVLGPETCVIGVSSKRLFGDMTEEEFRQFYYDTHLNRNGNEYFTHAVTPAILKAYERVETKLPFSS